MRHKFLVLAVKKWLKSVHIYGSYRKIKTGTVFWTTLYVLIGCQRHRSLKLISQRPQLFNGLFLGLGLLGLAHAPSQVTGGNIVLKRYFIHCSAVTSTEFEYLSRSTYCQSIKGRMQRFNKTVEIISTVEQTLLVCISREIAQSSATLEQEAGLLSGEQYTGWPKNGTIFCMP